MATVCNALCWIGMHLPLPLPRTVKFRVDKPLRIPGFETKRSSGLSSTFGPEESSSTVATEDREGALHASCDRPSFVLMLEPLERLAARLLPLRDFLRTEASKSISDCLPKYSHTSLT